MSRVREELVVPIGVASVIKGDEEEIASIEHGQLGLTLLPTSDRVAQRPAQRRQDGGLQQELPNVLGLAAQDLVDQVVDDVAIVSGEPGDERGRVIPPLDRERRHLQRGNPAFRPRFEGGDVRWLQGESHHAVQVGRGFIRRESQVGGPDLDELAVRSQAGKRKLRVGSGGHNEVHLAGEVLEQEGHACVHFSGVDDVVVIKNKHDVAM